MNSVGSFKIISTPTTHLHYTLTNPKPKPKPCLFFLFFFSRTSCGGESTHYEFSSQTAYELLGVSETSSFAEIKASFRRLAKQTHPDLAESRNDSDASRRFVQILAAYEILSDSEKRSHYDMYLLSQRKALFERNSSYRVTLREYNSKVLTFKHMEVVEWLKWYRFTIKEILSEKRVVGGNGYLEELEMDFYSAVRQAYYGPEIEPIESLPDRFEAEERSVRETPEVLHLVSGRDLFGMVCLASGSPELPFRSSVELESSSGTCRTDMSLGVSLSSQSKDGPGRSQAYSDLELWVWGRAVAVATRVAPGGDQNEDCIRVFLYSNESSGWIIRGVASDGVGSRIHLGTITGLGTSSEEGSCFVLNSSDAKTHVIVKHRTLLVKHLHWYGLGNEVSVCECRCSRARLPPSKFWLFEPRCEMHNTGGWYIETFGKDKKGRTVPSQRYWDGLDPSERFEKRLHPAMYLLALAYRSLDLEDSRIRKHTVVHHVQQKASRILSWCKKLV